MKAVIRHETQIFIKQNNITHPWKKASQNKDNKYKRGKYADAHTSRVEEGLTPVKRTNIKTMKLEGSSPSCHRQYKNKNFYLMNYCDEFPK